jgi:hypothetical protein
MVMSLGNVVSSSFIPGKKKKRGFQKILVKGVFIGAMAFLFGGFTPFVFTGRLFYFSFNGFRISTLDDVLQWVFVVA